MFSAVEYDDLMKQIGIVSLCCLFVFVAWEIIQDCNTIKSEVLTCSSGKFYCESSATNIYNNTSDMRLPDSNLIKNIRIKKSSKVFIHSKRRPSYHRRSHLHWDLKDRDVYVLYYVTSSGKSGKLLKTEFSNKLEAERVSKELKQLFLENKKTIIYKVEQ
ncbi:hypothetical protein HDR58_06895 [bacterium]|nr:hypothetical protein [bacterium]